MTNTKKNFLEFEIEEGNVVIPMTSIDALSKVNKSVEIRIFLKGKESYAEFKLEEAKIDELINSFKLWLQDT